MDIDRSKAPEGATHWDPGMNNRVAGWMRLDAGVWYWWPAEGALSCPKKWHASLNQHMIETEGFIELPALWTGEEPPPAGTVCEVRNSGLHNPVWEKCTILFCGKHRMVYDSESCSERCGYIEDLEFRPIRTAEQIAEEARIAELNLMIAAIKDYPGGQHGVDHLTQLRIHEEVCIDLYEAGWRKQVTS